ncbi:RNA pseudouridine synthase [Altererythrobacter confluentis]|uniref:RNA pseudouridine synthase n=1 Tax=Allopontixanthobacter confluentis TaxID=1849021 RepID=A0A6L7GBX8_9SPHN|nr:RluA family pseudouridine synthase [Allopontixanthobacter confluentis]MXP13397.1 RNA pseudouridine synthase [Allopontixanthobacter confluentis]
MSEPTNPQATNPQDGPSSEVRQFTVRKDDDDVRLDRWFKRHLPQIGFATVSRWARTGQIRIDGKRAKVDDRIATGQIIRVPPGGDQPDRGPNERRQLTEEEIELADSMVITQDRAAIVLNKLPGLATQGGTGMKQHVDALLDAYVGPDGPGRGPRPRLVHRLDKDTSGVLLVARTPGSAAFFSKRFAGRSAKKVYWALIVGVPDVFEGQIDAPLSKQPGTGGEKMHVDEENGQTARTRYRVIERAGNSACWVELQPLTGRTHQLRVHMAAIGHPIVGDGKYGGQDAFLTGSISRKLHLHARRLVIDHPDGAPLDVTAELPLHFAASMEQLGFDISLSEALPDDEPTPMSREQKKQSARQHSKQIRKERRGERRERLAGGRNEKDGVAKGRPKTGKSGPTKGKGSPKPASGKTAGAKPVGGKPAPRKSDTAKSAPGKRGAARSAPARGTPTRGGPRKSGPTNKGR